MSRGRVSLRLKAAAVVAAVALAAALLLAQTQKGDYSQENLGSSKQAETKTSVEGEVYSVEPYPLFTPRLAPGKNRALVEGYCHTCHSLRYIVMQPPLPAATWEAEVKKMIEVYGLEVPAEDVPKIVGYLKAHYTPETRKE